MIKRLLTCVLFFVLIASCAPANSIESPPSATPLSASDSTPIAIANFVLTPAASRIPSTQREESLLVFFVSEHGKFEAWMPISESIIEYTVPQMLFKKPVECPITVSRLNGAIALVEYCDLAANDISSLSEKLILQEVRNAMEKDFRLRIDHEQAGQINNLYPALTLSGEEDMRGLGYDGTFKARIILVEDRIYIVYMSVQSDNWCKCRDQIDQVVNSLYIEPGMSIPFKPTP